MFGKISATYTVTNISGLRPLSSNRNSIQSSSFSLHSAHLHGCCKVVCSKSTNPAPEGMNLGAVTH